VLFLLSSPRKRFFAGCSQCAHSSLLKFSGFLTSSRVPTAPLELRGDVLWRFIGSECSAPPKVNGLLVNRRTNSQMGFRSLRSLCGTHHR